MLALLAVVHEAAEAATEAAGESPWTFGWEALVAIGTLCLAAVTGGLALSTRKLAKSTRDESAATWRPVLVFQEDPELAYSNGDVEFTISIRNVGNGAAFTVRTAATFMTRGIVSTGRVEVRHGTDVVLYGYGFVEVPTLFKVWVNYWDLGRRQYSTAAVFSVSTSYTDEVGTVVPLVRNDQAHLVATLERDAYYVDRTLTEDDFTGTDGWTLPALTDWYTVRERLRGVQYRLTRPVKRRRQGI